MIHMNQKFLENNGTDKTKYNKTNQNSAHMLTHWPLEYVVEVLNQEFSNWYQG